MTLVKVHEALNWIHNCHSYQEMIYDVGIERRLSIVRALITLFTLYRPEWPMRIWPKAEWVETCFG
jgi:hypothetical protein